MRVQSKDEDLSELEAFIPSQLVEKKEYFQQVTVKGQGQRSHVIAREIPRACQVKINLQSEWSDAGREAQRGFGGPWRYSELGWAQS